MKTILIMVKVPDDIPDPEITVIARCEGTFDEWDGVPFDVLSLPTEEEIESESKSVTYNKYGLLGYKMGANFVINKIKAQ